MSPRLYIYKLIVDDGGAPCVTEDLWSLAICKPAIRSAAEEGAIIFGIGSNAAPLENRLIYIAVVTKKLTGGRYYEKPECSARADCVYERTQTGRLRRRATARFHFDPANKMRDIGPEPDYPRANVLLSSDFRYFGANGTTDYKRFCPKLTELVERLGVGHRVNHPEKLREELLQFKERVWRQYAEKMKLGEPTHPPQEYAGEDEEGCVEICAPRGHWLDDKCTPDS